MRLRQRSPIAILPLVLLGVMTLALSCAPAQAGPRAWIDWPPKGFETDVGTTVTLIAHAYAEDGVAEVQLAVDGQPYRVVTPEQAGEQFVEISADWLADEAGTYLLSIIAFDVNGQAGNPASVTVKVTGQGPGLLLTPSPLTTTLESPTVGPPTGTPEELPPATATVPPRSTGTPVPPTATPLPPRIASFEVNRNQITAGQCVRFSWRIDGSPTAIYFDGEGVTSPDSREKCPTATRDFELRAEGAGGGDTARLMVVVVEPSPTPDTQGPPAPGGLSPTDSAEVDCGSVTLSWNPASDPSGIAMYYVKVEQTTGEPKSGGWTTTDTELTIPGSWLECGQDYRWAVQAEDGVGNIGPSSAWGAFVPVLT